MSQTFYGDRRTLGGSYTAVSSCVFDAADEVIALHLDYVEYHRPGPPHVGPVFVLGRVPSGEDVFAIGVAGLANLEHIIAGCDRVESVYITDMEQNDAQL